MTHNTKCAVLYIAINKNNEELLEKYKNLSEKHNNQIKTDPYPNAGVDIFFRKKLSFPY